MTPQGTPQIFITNITNLDLNGMEHVIFEVLYIFENYWAGFSTGFNPITSKDEFDRWSKRQMAPPGLLNACVAWKQTDYRQSITLVDFLQKTGFDAYLQS